MRLWERVLKPSEVVIPILSDSKSGREKSERFYSRDPCSSAKMKEEGYFVHS